MSDFFSALLDRSLAQGPMLQRRPISRYEQLAPALPAALSLAEGTSTRPADPPATMPPAEGARGDWRDPVAQPAWPAPMARSQAEPSQTTSIYLVPETEPGPAPTPASSGSADRLARIDARLDSLQQRQSLQPAPLGAEPTARIEPQVQVRLVEPPAQLAVRQPAHADETTATPPIHPLPARPAGPDPVLAKPGPMPSRTALPLPTAQTRRSQDTPRAATPPVQPRPTVQPLFPPLPRPLATSPRPGVAPVMAAPSTIHVSIGRIEIKASSAPTRASQPSQATAPRLSLASYLKTRNGGQR